MNKFDTIPSAEASFMNGKSNSTSCKSSDVHGLSLTTYSCKAKKTTYEKFKLEESTRNWCQMHSSTFGKTRWLENLYGIYLKEKLNLAQYWSATNQISVNNGFCTI